MRVARGSRPSRRRRSSTPGRRCETGDEERRDDAQARRLIREARVDALERLDASRMSSSECAGESGSESTSSPARSATGSGGWSGKRSRYQRSRWTGRKWMLVAIRSSASARWYSSRVAPAARVDPDRRRGGTRACRAGRARAASIAVELARPPRRRARTGAPDRARAARPCRAGRARSRPARRRGSPCSRAPAGRSRRRRRGA